MRLCDANEPVVREIQVIDGQDGNGEIVRCGAEDFTQMRGQEGLSYKTRRVVLFRQTTRQCCRENRDAPDPCGPWNATNSGGKPPNAEPGTPAGAAARCRSRHFVTCAAIGCIFAAIELAMRCIYAYALPNK